MDLHYSKRGISTLPQKGKIPLQVEIWSLIFFSPLTLKNLKSSSTVAIWRILIRTQVSDVRGNFQIGVREAIARLMSTEQQAF